MVANLASNKIFEALLVAVMLIAHVEVQRNELLHWVAYNSECEETCFGMCPVYKVKYGQIDVATHSIT